jgi:malonyl-CoA/methylmalonyl-CoA synthetase
MGKSSRFCTLPAGLARQDPPGLAVKMPAMNTADSPLPQANLYSALRAAFPAQLGDTAIEVVDGETLHYSWRDLDHGSARIANLLESLALPAGSRVAAQTDKSVEALMLYLAVLRAGLVYLPLNPAYQAGEMRHFIEDAEPAVLVCSPRHFGWLSKLAFTQGVQHVFTLGEQRQGSLLERAAPHSDVHAVAERGPDELAVILYTSGTTGRSKGAMLSHGNMLSNALTLKAHWGWQRDDVLIHALPIFHIHGLFVAVHGALLSGSKMLWLARFEPHTVASLLPRATVFMGVPTMYVRLLAEPTLSPEACRGMRLFVSGSAPLLIDTFHRWQERTGHTILERYGMSETVMLASNPCAASSGERRGGTVGLPLPGVSIRVVDAHGRPCARGEAGGIEVKGPNVFLGYWKLPEKTQEEFTVDRWFKTGDVGLFDELGYLRIVGRSKDLIISGGFNVYPAEVEAALNDLPGVQESAVVGVPHPDFGEAVLALVVPEPGACVEAEALINTLKRQLANFKVPKQVLLLSELPRNAMGKVQKAQLRQQHQAMFAPL